MFKTHRKLKLGIAGILVLAAVLLVVLPVLADHAWFLQSVTCTGGNSITVTGELTDGGSSIAFVVYVDGVFQFDYFQGNPLPTGIHVLTFPGAPPGLLVPGAVVEVTGVNGNVSTVCSTSQAELVSPPDIFLSAVCEPNDGFSGDGWMTVDSNANSKPYGTMLYVAASADGPWVATEFLQPPYVMSQANVDALTAMLGLTDYHLLWLKASEWGVAANLGSMITDREWNMDALCGN